MRTYEEKEKCSHENTMSKGRGRERKRERVTEGEIMRKTEMEIEKERTNVKDERTERKTTDRDKMIERVGN